MTPVPVIARRVVREDRVASFGAAIGEPQLDAIAGRGELLVQRHAGKAEPGRACRVMAAEKRSVRRSP